jgi:hypothetical protein
MSLKSGIIFDGVVEVALQSGFKRGE